MALLKSSESDYQNHIASMKAIYGHSLGNAFLDYELTNYPAKHVYYSSYISNIKLISFKWLWLC